jgi:hypothetical protein
MRAGDVWSVSSAGWLSSWSAYKVRALLRLFVGIGDTWRKVSKLTETSFYV